MKNFLEILEKNELFKDISKSEIEKMITTLNPRIMKIKKNEYAACQGDFIRNLLILVEGGLHIQKEDYWGNLSILSEIRVGEIFGEAFIMPNSPPLMNDVVATSDSSILVFDTTKIFSNSRLIKNLFSIISEKNRKLVTKIGYMSKRTTREKLLSYLSDEAKKQKSNSFRINFNRQQLADFLSVDRSAMSGELSKMRKEKILSFNKNEFTINKLN